MSETQTPPKTDERYMIICLIRPEIASLKALEITNTLLNQFTDVTESQDICNYPLAYDINRNNRAHFVITKAVVSKQSIQLFRKRVGENEKFLRVFVTKDMNLDITENGMKNYTSCTTKRGRILIQKKMTRQKRGEIANGIKIRRFLGLMPYCDYYR